MDAKARRQRRPSPSATVAQEKMETIIASVQGKTSPRPDPRATHTPARHCFAARSSFSIVGCSHGGVTGWSTVRLHYAKALNRRRGRSLSMERNRGRLPRSYSADYTDSPYPLNLLLRNKHRRRSTGSLPWSFLGTDLTTSAIFCRAQRCGLKHSAGHELT